MSTSTNLILDRIFLERSIKTEEFDCDQETKEFRGKYDAMLQRETETKLAKYNSRTNGADYAVFWRKLSEEQKEKLLHDVYAIGDYHPNVDDEAVAENIKYGTLGDLELYLKAAIKRQKRRALRRLPKEDYSFPRFWEDSERKLEKQMAIYAEMFTPDMDTDEAARIIEQRSTKPPPVTDNTLSWKPSS